MLTSILILKYKANTFLNLTLITFGSLSNYNAQKSL